MRNLGTKKTYVDKAVSFMDKLGITFDVHPRHNLTIKIAVDDKHAKGFESPLFISMTADDLIDISVRIRSLGFCGKRVIKALISAIASLEDDEICDIMNNFYIKGYSAKQIVDHFFDTFIAYCIKANVRVSSKTIDKKFMRNIWISFGKTNGLAYNFLTVIKQELSYFRDASHVEEVMNIAPRLTIRNPKVSKCSTCKNCKIDSYGLKVCRALLVDIPTEYKTEQIGKIYPQVINDGGVLCSKYVMHDIESCPCYKSRIGATIIHDTNICKQVI